MRASWFLVFLEGLENLSVRGEMPLRFGVQVLLLMVRVVVTVHSFVARASTLATSRCVDLLQNTDTI